MANSMEEATMSPHLLQIMSIILCYLCRNLLTLQRESTITLVITFFRLQLDRRTLKKNVINGLEYRKYVWLEVARKFPLLV